MIQLRKLRIEEFRGIRELELEMDGKSLVVVGPNGSGKSGVVDAIDFVLTGNIARLSGAGTGSVSITKHAPHVHQRDNPAAARVALTFVHVASGQVGVLTRSVKSPTQFDLEPNTPELAAAVAWAGQHAELTLSRREVIKYVNAEPGKRAQEVQALLKLDRIDEIRRLLQAARNKTSSTAKAADAAMNGAQDAVKRILDTPELLASEVLRAVNGPRLVLGLEPLTTIAPETDLSAGSPADSEKAAFGRAAARRDVDAVASLVSSHPELDTAAGELVEVLAQLESDNGILESLRLRQLVEVGLPLATEANCPLCDLEWEDAAALQAHLSAKLARSEAAAKLRRLIDERAGRVVVEIGRLRGHVRTALPHSAALGLGDLQGALIEWAEDLAAFESKLTTLESTRDELSRLESDPAGTPPGMESSLAALKAAIDSLPDLSAADEARSTLSVAQDRWAQLRVARLASDKANAAQRVANTVYETYNSVADVALSTLYKTVEADFSDYYRQINDDDEASFKAGLEASAGKLDLEVDFYGLGMFPPMAYHSEGHQDGMGVCLYLALLGQLLKTDFRFAVLDDVVTSVDVNHRRQFCALLRDVFPDVQFIITTHDEVWARQMVSSGLVTNGSLARFYGWTVDGGPLYGQGEDFWARIDSDLSRNDVPGAAHKLRRNLEASLADIAASIRGQVAYRGDNNYDLSSFFNAVKGRHGELLKKGAASADSWKNDAARQQVADLKQQRIRAMGEQDGEGWAINALVHNNDWAAMSKADFMPVLEASKQFLALFTCDNRDCDGWLFVTGAPGREEALRCACGSYNLNLRSK